MERIQGGDHLVGIPLLCFNGIQLAYTFQSVLSQHRCRPDSTSPLVSVAFRHGGSHSSNGLRGGGSEAAGIARLGHRPDR